MPGLHQGKNGTFFSTSFEVERRPSTNTNQARMPTELERQGDFSQTTRRDGRGPLEVYDPLSTVSPRNGATAPGRLQRARRHPRFRPAGYEILTGIPGSTEPRSAGRDIAIA